MTYKFEHDPVCPDKGKIPPCLCTGWSANMDDEMRKALGLKMNWKDKIGRIVCLLIGLMLWVRYPMPMTMTYSTWVIIYTLKYLIKLRDKGK